MEGEEQQFEINLRDLWHFERISFEKNRLSLDFYEEVLEKMIPIVIQNTNPFVEEKMEGEKGWVYWKSKVSEYKHSLRKENPLYSELILERRGFYTHDSSVIVKRDQEDFHLWFALKLRHFDTELIKLPNFLDYHLKHSFDSNQDKFKLFLNIVKRQYGTELFSDRIIDTIKEWEELQINLPKVKTGYKKAPRAIKGNFNSFLFHSNNEKIDSLMKDINRISDLIRDLSIKRFIDRKTKVKSFQNTFQNKEIKPVSRIVWKGSNKELQWFIKYFVYEKELVESPGNDIWLLTLNCFVDKNGSEYKISSLSDATGTNFKRREELYDILNEYFM